MFLLCFMKPLLLTLLPTLLIFCLHTFFSFLAQTHLEIHIMCRPEREMEWIRSKMMSQQPLETRPFKLFHLEGWISVKFVLSHYPWQYPCQRSRSHSQFGVHLFAFACNKRCLLPKRIFPAQCVLLFTCRSMDKVKWPFCIFSVIIGMKV